MPPASTSTSTTARADGYNTSAGLVRVYGLACDYQILLQQLLHCGLITLVWRETSTIDLIQRILELGKAAKAEPRKTQLTKVQ